MAQLQFTVKNQTIKRIDEFTVIAGSIDYLYASFSFETEEWEGFTKTALFIKGDKAYSVLIGDNGECLVPWEVLTGKGFVRVSVFGGQLITTNLVEIFVAPTGYTEETENTKEPTPSVYDTVIGYLDDVKDSAIASAENASASETNAAESAESARQSAQNAEYHATHVDGGTFDDWKE